MDTKPFLIGMDFGTFKTSVAASNGKRDTLQTAVGWPKDHLARAMLGRDVVFGNDIVNQRLALDIVRPFEKGMLKFGDDDHATASAEDVVKRKRAAKLLVQQALNLVDPPQGAPVYAVIGAPSRASVANKGVLMEAVAGTFDAVVIVAEPFTVAYSMGRLTDTLVVDIGAGTIDICPMYGTYPKEEDQLTVPLGGDAVDEVFHDTMRRIHPNAQLSLNMAREIKEKHGFVHDVEETAIVALPVDGVPTEFDVTEPLKQACKALVGPIVDGLRQTVARFDPEFQRPLLENILLGGGGSQLKGLDRLIEEALQSMGGGSVTRVYDSVFAGAVGALKLAMNMPPENWESLREPRANTDVETQPLRKAG
jgi:rod shape-determining protein MreB